MFGVNNTLGVNTINKTTGSPWMLSSLSPNQHHDDI